MTTSIDKREVELLRGAGISERVIYPAIRPENWTYQDPVEDLPQHIQDILENERKRTTQDIGDDEIRSLTETLKRQVIQHKLSVRTRDGLVEYFSESGPGEDYYHYFRVLMNSDGTESKKEELFDFNTRKKELSDQNLLNNGFYAAGSFQTSKNDDLFAWLEDPHGAEHYDLIIRHRESQEQLGKVIKNVDDFVFSPCGRFVFWTKWISGRPSAVCRRTLDDGESDEETIYEAEGEDHWLGLSVTTSYDHIVIHTATHDSDGFLLISGTHPTKDPVKIAGNKNGRRYMAFDSLSKNELAVIEVDFDTAIDGKIMKVREDSPGSFTWDTWDPHEKVCLIRTLYVYKDFMVYKIKKDKKDRLVFINRNDESDKQELRAPDRAAYTLTLMHDGYETDRVLYKFKTLVESKTVV